MPWRDHGFADAMAPEAALLDHPPGTQRMLRVLEDAAEASLLRALRVLPLGLHRRDRLLDLQRRPGSEAKLDPGDDLTRNEHRVAVAEVERVFREPLCSFGLDDEPALWGRRPRASA